TRSRTSAAASLMPPSRTSTSVRCNLSGRVPRFRAAASAAPRPPAARQAGRGPAVAGQEASEQPAPPTAREPLNCGFVSTVGPDRDLFSGLLGSRQRAPLADPDHDRVPGGCPAAAGQPELLGQLVLAEHAGELGEQFLGVLPVIGTERGVPGHV